VFCLCHFDDLMPCPQYLVIIIIMPITYTFQPIALETLGPVNGSAAEFLSDLRRRISSYSGDEKAVILVPTFINRSAAL